VLTLPGWLDSGPDHWQTRWEAVHPGVTRVVQRDWLRPRCADWVERLDAAVRESGSGVVLAAHSLGCLLAARWAALPGRRVRGALLVAVPDPAGPSFPRDAIGFAPVPARRLPFPAVVVASRDDPYASTEFSAGVASDWGARLVDAGAAGHLNGDSGLGDWPEGMDLIRALAGDTAP
jgi:hypothetical protein